MDLYELLKLKPGYCVRIDEESVCGHEYLCDTDDLIDMAREVLALIDRAEHNQCGCLGGTLSY